MPNVPYILSVPLVPADATAALALRAALAEMCAADVRDGAHVITAVVPLANLFGYTSALMHMTHGSAGCTMTFSHYEQAPPAIGPRRR